MKRINVIQRRQATGQSAGDFADTIGTTMNVVYSVESGRTRPRKEIAQAWAAALGMTLAEAFPELAFSPAAQEPAQ